MAGTGILYMDGADGGMLFGGGVELVAGGKEAADRGVEDVYELLEDGDGAQDREEEVYKPGIVKPIFVPACLFTLERELVLAILPLFAKEFTDNGALLGFVASVYGIGRCFANIPAGSITSVYGSKTTYTLAVSIELSAAIFGVFANSIWLLVASRLLAGTAMSFYDISRKSFVLEVVPENIRGSIFSSFGAIRRVSALISPIIGGALIQYTSMSFVFVAQIGLCIVAMVWGTIFISGSIGKNEYEDDKPAEIGNPLVELKRFYNASRDHSRNLFKFGTYSFLLAMVREGRMFVLPTVVSYLGFSPANVGFCVGLGFAFDTMTVPIGGFILDRYGRKAVGCATPVFLTLGFITLAFVSLQTPNENSTFVMLCSVAAILGAGNGLSGGILGTIGVDLASTDPAQRGYLLGSFKIITDIGSIVGPAVAGLALTFSPFISCIALAVLSVLTALWSYLYLYHTSINE
eukprot:CAMPEP_0203753248 /NCGR_PEP_ID=MMETSP0098-20131031/7043_1 /ASSEMBLY_ACC=CAM_ASM_000208 /TAXON_ID=96639 /ORGANISM=" , Strain NY0313808BC1" /LENGTH=462 /DNA_ID=CAMNT_0050643755 /DNA_START=142 /DNA_END=1530 /DNA_ORIENTATION=-